MPHHQHYRSAELLSASPFANLPVMACVAADPAAHARKPFAGLGVAALLHLRPTLVAMVAGWIGLGLDPDSILVLAKDYDYPERANAEAALAALRVRVAPLAEADRRVPQFVRGLGGRRFLAVEDGGHIVPLVASEPGFIGGIEQTTKGIRRVRAALGEPRLPLLSLPGSRFKSAFEPVHVARSGVQAIAKLVGGFAHLKPMKVALLGGAGVIGAAMAHELAMHVARVSVFDCRDSEEFELLSYGRVHLAASAREAVAEADLVVGASGECVLRARDLAQLKDGAILASMGSDRTEFPVELLERLAMRRDPFHPPPDGDAARAAGTIFTMHGGRRVVLLCGGRPVNFAGAAPPEAAPFDIVMGAMLAASVELAQGRFEGQHGFLDVFDDIVDRHRLVEIFLASHSGGTA